ncbi:MAG TPA: MFS transporter [Bryobacteraceae bacterium]|nr:MFS transporter [Bryobacteraceae bacterium]
MASAPRRRIFFGWFIILASIFTFGIAVGIPYYNIPFFYDYFQKTFHWRLDQITFGFPLAALLTIWVGPVLIPRYSPRKLILIGTALTALSLCGMGLMLGNIYVYYGLWFLYTVGYLFSGPIPHQILVSYWFQKKRGMAMGIVYVGVGMMGALGAKFVRPLTETYGFHTALIVLGLLMFLTWPLAIFVIRDKPSEIGLFPDGLLEAPADLKREQLPFRNLMKSWPFWLLLIGSVASIGSIGAINFHMKFVFRDSGFTQQSALNQVWSTAQFWILISSIVGRLTIGYFADVFPKKWVMTATYFIVSAAIPLLLMVTPVQGPMVFAIVFGYAMGADYMLIPLMAAEQFGVNSLARAMAIILPANTIGQTWFPQLVSILREHYGAYGTPMAYVFMLAVFGAISIAILPRFRQVTTNSEQPQSTPV